MNPLPPMVYEICDRILSCVDAEKIILFGSYAYGTPTKDSDFDFYVVLPDDYPDNTTVAAQTIYLNLYKTHLGVSVDIITHPQTYFNERSVFPTLERKIAREGVTIYDRNGRH